MSFAYNNGRLDNIAASMVIKLETKNVWWNKETDNKLRQYFIRVWMKKIFLKQNIFDEIRQIIIKWGNTAAEVE